MSAFFVARIDSVKDADKFAEYGRLAGESFARHGATLLIKGAFERALTGDLETKAVSIVKFPTLETLKEWYASDAYQELIPLRDAAADLSISAFSASS